jgi:hypothetical protein
MSANAFVRATLLSPGSPACAWKHPLQASRLVRGAARNALIGAAELVARGNGHACPICGWTGRAFRTFLSADEIIPDCICPECGSFDRQRLLAIALRRELDDRGRPHGPLLAVAQSLAMQQFLLREGAGRCFRTDVIANGPFGVDLVTDLRAAAIGTGSVQWLFCSHVLEHVADLDACLAEISRLLRPDGTAWVQVPQEPGLERSRRIPQDPHRAHAHAWQFGTDFAALIARPAWQVEEVAAVDLAAEADRRRWGIAADERLWILRRLPL